MDLSFADAAAVAASLSAVAAIAVFEKLFPFAPSVPVFVSLGVVTGSNPSALSSAILAAAFGSWLGTLFWYGVGRLIGVEACRRLFRRHGYRIFLPPDLFDRTISAFARNDIGAVIAAHTIPTVRIFVGLFAGVVRLPAGRFMSASAVGNLIWIAPLMIAGAWLSGTGASPLQIGLCVVAAVLGVEALLFLGLHRLRRRSPRCPANDPA